MENVVTAHLIEEVALNRLDEADQLVSKSLAAFPKLSAERRAEVLKRYASNEYSYLYDAVRMHRDERRSTAPETRAFDLMDEAEKDVEKSLELLRGLSHGKQADLFNRFISKDYSSLNTAVDMHRKGKAANDTVESDDATVATHQSMESILNTGEDTTMFFRFEKKNSKVMAMISRMHIPMVGRASDCAMLGTHAECHSTGPRVDDEEVFDAIKKLGAMDFGISAQFYLVLNENGLATGTHSDWKKKISFFGTKKDPAKRSQNLRDFWKVMLFGGMEDGVSRRLSKGLKAAFIAERKKVERDSES